MTRSTALGAAILGAILVTSTVALAGYPDRGPESSSRGRSAIAGTSERATDDDALDQLFDRDGTHEPRNDTCAYPNYYGVYPNYYVGPDGRGHFCTSWTHPLNPSSRGADSR
jgi:hypothetical protein